MSFIKIKYKTCFENFTIFLLGSNKSCWRQTQRIYIFRARCGNCKASNRAVESELFSITPSSPKTCPSVLPSYSILQKRAFLSLHIFHCFLDKHCYLELFWQKWGETKLLARIGGYSLVMLLCAPVFLKSSGWSDVSREILRTSSWLKNEPLKFRLFRKVFEMLFTYPSQSQIPNTQMISRKMITRPWHYPS